MIVSCNEPLLLDAKALAHLLGVARCTVWSWLSSGRIPSPVRIGGTVRWRRDEIEAWIIAGAPPRERWSWERGNPECRVDKCG